MSKTYTGFVAKLTSKSGNTRGRAWTAHSGRVEEKDTGVEYDLWFKFGFDAPPCQEGDYVRFEAEDDGKVVPGSVKVSSNPPARPQSKRGGGGGQQGGGGSGGGSAQTKSSDLFGSIGGYNSEDDIARITRSTALNQAVATVALLLENDALSIPKAKNKATEAKRFEVVTAAIDKLAVKYFFDLATGRQLENVQDPGAVGATQPAGLPDDFDESEEEQEEMFEDNATSSDDDGFDDNTGGDDDEHFS